VRFTVHGDGGRLPTHVATPLSVVLIELLQNAIDHGFPEGSQGGDVVVLLARSPGMLSITVVNDGVGLEPGFELNSATGLGLSIVRTLVTTELGGTITMRAGSRTDFDAVGISGVRDGTGTVVDLQVPIS
jgi:two-component sensor histidine kinase